MFLQDDANISESQQTFLQPGQFLNQEFLILLVLFVLIRVIRGNGSNTGDKR